MVTDWVKNLPIRQKIQVFSSLTAAVVLIAASITFVMVEYISTRQSLVESSSTLVNVVAINSAAALAFHDQEAAKEVLAALSSEANVISAHLYTLDGEMFATYSSQQPQHNRVLQVDKATSLGFKEEKRRAYQDARASAEFKDGVLDIVGPVLINELPLGIIGIQV
ncbi:MAG: CHASE sensor domain-containing protein, partial [Candidatus Nitrotoga sp.]